MRRPPIGLRANLPLRDDRNPGTVQTVTAHAQSEGWVLWSCDQPGCIEHVRFRPDEGEPAPEGWREEPAGGDERTSGAHHYCPEHAHAAAERSGGT